MDSISIHSFSTMVKKKHFCLLLSAALFLFVVKMGIALCRLQAPITDWENSKSIFKTVHIIPHMRFMEERDKRDKRYKMRRKRSMKEYEMHSYILYTVFTLL